MSPGHRARPSQAPPLSSPPQVQQPATPPMSSLQHHNTMPPSSAALGDTNSHPRVNVIIISRDAELVVIDEHLSLIIVTLVGGNRPAISPNEVRAHLCAWLHRASWGPSTPPRQRCNDIAAADEHDTGGAHEIELNVPERMYNVESAPDPMQLEADLAAQSPVVPPVSQATLLEAPPCHVASSSGAVPACGIPPTV
jgi:hypothetical protein